MDSNKKNYEQPLFTRIPLDREISLILVSQDPDEPFANYDSENHFFDSTIGSD